VFALSRFLNDVVPVNLQNLCNAVWRDLKQTKTWPPFPQAEEEREKCGSSVVGEEWVEEVEEWVEEQLKSKTFT